MFIYKLYQVMKYIIALSILYSITNFENLAVILDYKYDIFDAISITISMSLICFILSISVAYLLSEFKNSNNKFLSGFSTLYESCGKLSIEIAIIKLFYALVIFISVFKQQLFNEDFAFIPNPYYIAIIGISFVYSSYLISNFSSSIDDFKEEIKLLRVYNISSFQLYYQFKIKFVFNKCRNAIKNNFLMVSKATGLASLFGVNELFAVTNQIGKSTHNLLSMNILLFITFYVLTSIVLKTNKAKGE